MPGLQKEKWIGIYGLLWDIRRGVACCARCGSSTLDPYEKRAARKRRQVKIRVSGFVFQVFP